MRPEFLQAPFQLHIAFDLAATFLFAVSGTLAALAKRYDLVGVLVLAFVTGLGGALLRDGIFLQQGPPAVITDGRYLLAVLAGAGFGSFFGRRLHALRVLFVLTDAAALGIYGMVGVQKALAAGLPEVTAVLVGMVNAVGGSLLRDVLVREEPLVFKPGEFYALAALGGVVLFAVLTRVLHWPDTLSALVAIAVAFALRVLALRLGWRTEPMSREDGTGSR